MVGNLGKGNLNPQSVNYSLAFTGRPLHKNKYFCSDQKIDSLSFITITLIENHQKVQLVCLVLTYTSVCARQVVPRQFLLRVNVRSLNHNNHLH